MKDEKPWRDFYEAAIAFRDLKPWNWMHDDELFGVEDPISGETNYCCIMGNAGEYFALGLYLGEEGLKSYLLLSEMADAALPVDQKALVFNQLMLKVEFTDPDILTEKERKLIKDLGLSMGDKNQWVAGRFLSPDRPEYPITTEQAILLTHALQQAIQVCKRTEKNIDVIYGPEDEVLVRKPSKDGDSLIWKDSFEAIQSFDIQPFPIIDPSPALVEKAKEKYEFKEAALLCIHQYMDTPVLDDEKQMVLPKIAIWLSYPKGMMVSTEIIMPKEGMQTLEQSFFKVVDQLGFIPSQIGCNSMMGILAFDDLAEAMEIELMFIPEEPIFEEVMESMSQFFQ